MNAGSPRRRPSPGRGAASCTTELASQRVRPATLASEHSVGKSRATVPDDLVEVARVVDAYGVNGWIRIAAHEAPSDSVLRGARRCWMELPAGTPPRLQEIAAIRIHGSALVAQLPSCNDRDAALSFKGAALLVPRAEFPRTASDEYYWVDLVGCSVLERDGAQLGTVSAVDDFGAHAILRVADCLAPESEMLIPFVAAYIVSVDVGARRIVTDWRRDY